jgi:hypothetical protein
MRLIPSLACLLMLPLLAGCALCDGTEVTGNRDPAVLVGAEMVRHAGGNGALRALRIKLGAFARDEIEHPEGIDGQERTLSRRADDIIAGRTSEIDYRAGVGLEFGF